MEKVNLGEFIYQRRKSLGLSQKDIADFLAVSVSSVFKWEKNERLPDLSLFGSLAKTLKVDLESLVEGSENLNNNYDLENEFNIESFSKFFAVQRKINNYSLQELADKLNISYQTISKWEKQESLPNIYTLIECSKLFKISLVELYYGRLFNEKKQNIEVPKKNNKRNLFYLLGSVVLVLFVILGITLNNLNDNESTSNNSSLYISNVESQSSLIDSNNSFTGTLSMETSSSSNSVTDAPISEDFVVEETEKGLKLVKYIGSDKYVNVPEGIVVIGPEAFSSLNILEITLPSTLVEIQKSAFENCGVLKKVSMCDNVENIDLFTFNKCISLETINLSKNLICLRERTFSECVSLKEIIIPSSVNKIENCAFYSCSNLEKVLIEEGVISISYNVFENCTSLKNISIPNSIRHIEENVFNNCENILYNTYKDCLYLGNELNNYVVLIKANNKELANYEINAETRIIGEFAFASCEKMSLLNLTDKIVQIGFSAFINCKNLTSIKIPGNISELANSSFSRCSSLEKVEIEEGLLYIYSYAFSGCTSLKEVVFPNSIQYIAGNVFYNCDNMSFIEYDNGLYCGTSTNEYAYFIKAKNVDITSCIINSETQVIAGYAFDNCEKIKEIKIPSKITVLCGGVFNFCTKLEKIILPEGIDLIDIYAISNCYVLNEIYYRGSKEQWDKIEIHEFEKEKLKSVNIIYNYKN